MRSTLALLSLAAAALFVRTWRRTRPRAAAAAPTTDWCAIKPEWCGDDRRWREWYANSPLANASAAWAAVWRRLATADIALVAPVRAAASDDDKAPFKAHASRVAQLAAAVDRHPCRAAGLLELLPAHRPGPGS